VRAGGHTCRRRSHHPDAAAEIRRRLSAPFVYRPRANDRQDRTVLSLPRVVLARRLDTIGQTRLVPKPPTESDGTHSEPLPPIMPSPPTRHPKYATSGGKRIAQSVLAGHGKVATNPAKLAAFPASSVIPPQLCARARRRSGGSAAGSAGA
jgi:hypothetical protein